MKRPRLVPPAAALPIAMIAVAALAAEPSPAEPSPAESAEGRPTMRQLPPKADHDLPPPPRDVTASRAELRRRYSGALAHTETAAGARLAAETLLTAAVTEADRTLKWTLLDEARRLGEAAGEAALVSRAIGLASATYEFDAIDLELRCLRQIPLRGIDARRAAAVADAAEDIATRAAADRRFDRASDASSLAVRAWQRAGNTEAARRAAMRRDSPNQSE